MIITEDKLLKVINVMNITGIPHICTPEEKPMTPTVTFCFAKKYKKAIFFVPDPTNFFGWKGFFYIVNKTDDGKPIDSIEAYAKMVDYTTLEFQTFNYKLFSYAFQRHYLEVIDNVDEALSYFERKVNLYRSKGLNIEDYMIYDHREEAVGEDILALSSLQIEGDDGLFYEIPLNGDNCVNREEGAYFGGDILCEGLQKTLKGDQRIYIGVVPKRHFFENYPYLEDGKSIRAYGLTAGVVIEEFETKEDILSHLKDRTLKLYSKYRDELDIFYNAIEQAERK